MNRVIVEMVTPNGQPLPPALRQIFPDWKMYTSTRLLAVYAVELEYLRDLHLDALDKAYKGGQICHWTTDEGYNALTYNR